MVRELSVHQEHEVLLKLEQAGLDKSLAQSIINSPGNALAKSMIGSITKISAEEPKSSGRKAFELEVDGTKILEQLIADGKYDWKNPDIKEKNFPIKDKTKRMATIELFHFGFDISSESAVKAMEKEGFRPATIEELLALGAKHPELQKEFPIIALGSVWKNFDGYRGVPELYWDDSERDLRLNDWAGGWRGRYRFAGVRNNT
ncbi:MAG TPA: hypothetical protein VIH31_01605 [Candidatus Paceibacterota bacterium]